MKRLVITEDEQKHIRKLYNINEIDAEKVVSGLFDYAQKIAKGEVTPQNNSTTSGFDSTSNQSFETGQYYIHPKASDFKINYKSSNAIPLNSHAELLLKSIFAEAGTPNLQVSSTLRTYEDQARVNSQNRREDISNWYGSDVATEWDKLKANQISLQQFANYLRDRDKKKGKLMSNHLSNLAIDVVPYSDKFASTAERLMKQGNSGIKKVLREQPNNAVHIEFNFPVTGESNMGELPSGKTSRKSEVRADKAVSKSGILVDRKNNTSDYAIVFGGSPSKKYGAQFMYQQGTNILNNKNVIYSNFENSLETVLNYIKSIDPQAQITSVSGFSAGGKNAWKAAQQGYKAGLIDPVVTDETFNLLGPSLDKLLPSNIKMVSRSQNWSGNFKHHGDNLKKIENIQPGILRNIRHDQMPAKFFQDFADFV